MPDGNIISGMKFAGQDAYDLLKMAKLLGIGISKNDKRKLMDIIHNDAILHEKFKKEADSL